MSVQVEPVIGRYLRLEIGGVPHRVYVEEAGQGVPLLCLHTAGSDSRQFRDLLNDPAVLADFRVITFDLPWHGKSSPPDGWWREHIRADHGRVHGDRAHGHRRTRAGSAAGHGLLDRRTGRAPPCRPSCADDRRRHRSAVREPCGPLLRHRVARPPRRPRGHGLCWCRVRA